ncbi:hypothetical protein SAY87_030626 [Trapa incisa]|uniref:Zeta toxin domain-containing protein n=1 Tax=Trapa incisa TaxID=236973 RepID=A0AAN7KPU1_9MYRT|nr:hypothetical protein SAY87_030626 [Trapa incisa]
MEASENGRIEQTPSPKSPHVVPRLERMDSSRVGAIESFSNYVARQLGFDDESECPQLSKLVMDYLKKTAGCEESIKDYFGGEPDPDSLADNLEDELERCILSYFSFHWDKATVMINQVISPDTEQKSNVLKSLFFAATRKQRFEKVTENLKVTRVFSTLVDEMKTIRSPKDSNCTDVMAPVAHSNRSPVLLLMGGGAGAGKSTILENVKKQPFWAEASENAVYVDGDAFKVSDVVYQALNSKGRHDDMLQTAELVHQSSMDAASSVLVTALNEGRDVIMDSTLSWEPFVVQMIEMARDVHKRLYRMGVGYKVAEDGSVTEKYWEPVPPNELDGDIMVANKKPYRIELVGVVCDPYLAVVRGIRRAVIVNRAVRVNSQLKSHQRFASNFRKYCDLVDNARLYCTNATGGPPTLIAWKEGKMKLLVEPEEIKCLSTVSKLNPDATSIYELYPDPSPIFEAGSIWNHIHLSPSRSSIQLQLKSAIKKREGHDKPIGN